MVLSYRSSGVKRRFWLLENMFEHTTVLQTYDIDAITEKRRYPIYFCDLDTYKNIYQLKESDKYE